MIDLVYDRCRFFQTNAYIYHHHLSVVLEAFTIKRDLLRFLQ